MSNIPEEVMKQINEAEYILIGCGEELAVDRRQLWNEKEREILSPLSAFNIKKRQDLIELIEDNDIFCWLETILLEKIIRNNTDLYNVYLGLEKIIKNKDYFIVTMNTDGLIQNGNLISDKIVEPCGTIRKFQCSCMEDTWENDDYFFSILKKIPVIIQFCLEKDYEQVKQLFPVCPSCKKQLEYNIIGQSEKYNENGYIKQWNQYLNWLSKTLNKNLVLLELGVTFHLPGVIRWPFEKTAFLNQKAKLIRINATYPQISQKIKDKAVSYPIHSKNFLSSICVDSN